MYQIAIPNFAYISYQQLNVICRFCQCERELACHRLSYLPTLCVCLLRVSAAHRRQTRRHRRLRSTNRRNCPARRRSFLRSTPNLHHSIATTSNVANPRLKIASKRVVHVRLNGRKWVHLNTVCHTRTNRNFIINIIIGIIHINVDVCLNINL